MRGKKCEKPCKHQGQKGEEGEEALISTRADSPLQPMEEMMQLPERTVVEQISILQPVEDPMPELVDTSRKICGLWRARGREGLL